MGEAAILAIDLDILTGLVLLAVAFVGASAGAVWLYGRFAKRARGAPSNALPVAGPPTAVDRLVAPLTEARAGLTGVRLIADNREAFAVRALTARGAGRSLDLAYYLWRGDLTGQLMAAELLAAADRGVRVRLMLDDINTRGLDPAYLALSGHPLIEVRLFNPAKNRVNPWRRGLEMLLRVLRVTRRMHHKIWLVDGRVAIVGGRNIGDTYFDAGVAAVSTDMDAVVLGPAVQAVEAVFDSYWNSALVLPIGALWRGRQTNLQGLRRGLARLAASDAAMRYLGQVLTGAEPLGAGPLHWTSAARFISDPPEKTQGRGETQWLIRTLEPLLAGATAELQIVSAYLVPDARSVARLRALAARGVRVAILTNSLASTNQVSVHGAYARSRERFLSAGVQLFELKRDNGIVAPRPATLHAKTVAIDGRIGFVGSYNFDMRSAYLNTEMGLLVEHPPLVEELRAEFARVTAPVQSYALYLEGGALRWRDGTGGVLTREPAAARGRRLVAWVIGWLPIRGQL